MSSSTKGSTAQILAWSVLRVRGPETESFLQGQLSQDLRTLEQGSAWSLLLAPDSVVITTGWLTRREDGVDVVVPSERLDVAMTRLRRFLLRSRCTIEATSATEGPFTTVEEQIEASWPGPREFAASLTPHCFGSTFVRATVSFAKGCFTGQELVARLDSRGSPVPWRLVAVSGPSIARVNEVLMSKGPQGPQGVTSARESVESVVGLGFAHRSLCSAQASTLPSDVTIRLID